jgi:hypothetical protein
MENETKISIIYNHTSIKIKSAVASLWKEQRTVPAKPKKSSTLKITQARSSSDP